MKVELLLSQYQSLVVALPQAESLTIKRDEAQAWTRTAEALLSRPLSADLTTEYQVLALTDETTQALHGVSRLHCLSANLGIMG